MFSLPKTAPTEQPKPEHITIRPYTSVKYGDDAGEVVAGDLPKDHFIHALRLRVSLGTLSGGSSGNWNSNAAEKIIKKITVKAEGTRYFKQGTWDMFKQVCIANLEKQSDGSIKLYFTDPKIPAAKALPSWKFTSLVVELDFEAITNLQDGDRTSQSGTKIIMTVEESVWNGQDITNWPVLVEANRTKKTYGTDTDWVVYDHERSNVVVALLYLADDNGTPNDTIFDKVKVIGRTEAGQFPIYDEVGLPDVREANKNAFNGQALGTGFFMLEWPGGGLNTKQFTSLKSELYIDSAGTNAGLRVLERYLL